MKADWDQLGSEFADSSSVLIGDADCTDSAKSLCEKFQVQGYPTIKYFKDGDMTDGDDYKGGRDIDSLRKFIDDELAVKCNVNDVSECTEKEKSYIEKMKEKTLEDRKAQLERLSKMQGSSMKAELKRWLNQRLNILKGLDQEL
mmetsp:Transcript_10805/g.12368  ORF Transcript_10805/g.12368 Transcript_10805/m.12368 type:complete len:144 (-) Transcript_10805:335-766(-)|eukprot:CAMPEP_0194145512 /NCGR_PEP_ID=MMETSP0152-20130528/17475_1 /TAXON_ID=1049557 /ORGANISM="Thalassiothrix antarctica, Strain L6-D1" /LENGTH=143 /DNA_ID=CAMNT_0038845773 /DNA_START=212 /DNA_END=643 /DNA_ORIENTATION=+